MRTRTPVLSPAYRELRAKTQDGARLFWTTVGDHALMLLKQKGPARPQRAGEVPIHEAVAEIIRQFRSGVVIPGYSAEERLTAAIAHVHDTYTDSEWTIVDPPLARAGRIAIELVDDAFFEITQREQKEGRRLNRNLVAQRRTGETVSEPTS